MVLLGITSLKSLLESETGGMPPDLPSFVSRFWASLFHINNFNHYDLVPSSIAVSILSR